jgi:Cys-tRNA synthase (O-phospho-L-seryl-tRNA:Cys-tRNA synthase)
MTTDLIARFDTLAIIATSSGAHPFTEDVQQALCIKLERKAGGANGIAHMIMHAINSGDTDVLDQAAAVAFELAEELQKLANIAGQLKAAGQAA